MTQVCAEENVWVRRAVVNLLKRRQTGAFVSEICAMGTGDRGPAVGYFTCS